MVKKKGKAIGAVRAARLGAPHAAGSDTDRNALVALCPAGWLCWWGLRGGGTAPTVAAPCPGDSGSSKPTHLCCPRARLHSLWLFQEFPPFSWGRELLFLLLPPSGIGGSPRSQDVCVAVGLQDGICSPRSPAQVSSPLGPSCPLQTRLAPGSRCCDPRGRAGWRHPLAG